MTTTFTTVAGLGGATLSSTSPRLTSGFVKSPMSARNPLRQAVAMGNGGWFTCFKRNWLRADYSVIGFGLIGWITPSSIPAIKGGAGVGKVVLQGFHLFIYAMVNDVDEDVLQIFFKERELNGDFIARASDLLWRRNFRNSGDYDISKLTDNSSQQTKQIKEIDIDGGFLKLTTTQDWLSGDNLPPTNKKMNAKVLQDNRARRKKLNMLKYESLKREILLLSMGIGLACSGYCLIVLSAQAAISYVIGVLFSCLYLQLLYQHADNLSNENVPEIFKKKKTKKIGIRSEDLEDFLERLIKGSSISLTSPRLVIPAAIYGLWVLFHQYFTNDFFDFQIVPAMFGMFVYKAAVLVQVYRDNEGLQFVFPENEEASSG